ncbi:MAG: ABC transporter permease [Lachnospiraceae bacterium]|nr:ABC transporter permease [Lachnospiraceae bacterium]MCD7765012.1 ABC transporter permease [Lachnospiraceae bacterium]
MANAATVTKASSVPKRKKDTQLRQITRRLVKSKTAMLGLIVLVIIVLACVFAPLIAPYDPNYMDYTSLNAGSSLAHIMGCDNLGRDIFSRILYGGRMSLMLGFTVAIVGMVFGVFFGCIVGYYGGQVDNIAMRICDVWMAIPGTLLAIVISSALGSGFGYTVLALSVSGLPGSVRGTRAMALKEREMEYLEAAKAMNCSKMKIMFKHMMPNIIAPTIVGTTGQIGGTMMSAAGLSYIGLGIQPPTAEWGAMCSSAREYLTKYPHEMLWPGFVILLTVLAINLLGDGLRDAMDPRLKD